MFADISWVAPRLTISQTVVQQTHVSDKIAVLLVKLCRGHAAPLLRSMYVSAVLSGNVAYFDVQISGSTAPAPLHFILRSP